MPNEKTGRVVLAGLFLCGAAAASTENDYGLQRWALGGIAGTSIGGNFTLTATLTASPGGAQLSGGEFRILARPPGKEAVKGELIFSDSFEASS